MVIAVQSDDGVGIEIPNGLEAVRAIGEGSFLAHLSPNRLPDFKPFIHGDADLNRIGYDDPSSPLVLDQQLARRFENLEGFFSALKLHPEKELRLCRQADPVAHRMERFTVFYSQAERGSSDLNLLAVSRCAREDKQEHTRKKDRPYFEATIPHLCLLHLTSTLPCAEPR